MTTIRMTPSRRLFLAGAGYLLLYVLSQWQPHGLLGSSLVALLCLGFALVLLRAAAPEPMKPKDHRGLQHPVQEGKRRLLHRNLGLRPATGPLEVR